MKLPTEQEKAEVNGFPECDSWLVFGKSKVGKTTFASTWPEPLIIDLEGGAQYVTAYKMQPDDLGDLNQIYKALKHEDHPYKTVVVDTIDMVNDLIQVKVCRDMGIDMMGEAGFSMDWITSKHRVMNYVKMMSKLPVNLILVSHSRTDQDGNPSRIDLPGSLARKLMGYVNNILYCKKAKDGRVIDLNPLSSLEAGSRNPILDGAESCELHFDALEALFDEDKENKETKLIEEGDEDE